MLLPDRTMYDTIAHYTSVYHGTKDSRDTQVTLPITKWDLASHGVNTPEELIARWNGQDATRWTYYLED